MEAILSEGTRLIRFQSGFDPEEYGELPLPPYIKEPVEDTHRYQTIYSKHLGSVAAPTAGLHFTEGLLQEIKRREFYEKPSVRKRRNKQEAIRKEQLRQQADQVQTQISAIGGAVQTCDYFIGK